MERIQVGHVAKITGMSPRWVRRQAAAGLIPSAAQFDTVWTFDEAVVRQWVHQKEETARDRGDQHQAAAASNGTPVTRSMQAIQDAYDLLKRNRPGKRKPGDSLR